jgi:hypothetical protein
MDFRAGEIGQLEYGLSVLKKLMAFEAQIASILRLEFNQGYNIISYELSMQSYMHMKDCIQKVHGQ